MGYTTEFEGQIKVTPPLSAKEIVYLNKFSESRRMARTKSPYFVGGGGDFGQAHESDVVNYNEPPEGQPGLWCQWVPTEDGTAIEWDGNEKFYYAAEWMQYLIDHFIGLNPIAKQVEPEAADFLQLHTFEGVIDATGEEPDDVWRLSIKDGQQVFVTTGEVTVNFNHSQPVNRQTGNKRLT